MDFTLWQSVQLTAFCMVVSLLAPACLWVLCYYFPPPSPPTHKAYEAAWFLALVINGFQAKFDPPEFIIPKAQPAAVTPKAAP
jgi:hypothetical protein